MNEFAPILCLALFCLLLVQLPFLLAFASAVGKYVSAARSPQAAKAALEAPTPPITVVLCVRGADPFLPACLEGLLNQDYPDYRLRITIDSPDDPAWAVVERTVKGHPAAVQVSSLKDRLLTCCLKCSSLVQALSDLDPDCQVVAILDADVVPHRTYLRELVAPLADSRIGVASGNRWYVPVWNQWGSLVRYVFNASAVMQMHAYKMPFGGAIAFKADILRRSPLLERWSRSLTDTPVLAGVFREQGLGVAFVPSLMMGNFESCELPSFISWMKRQLLMVRLYHPPAKWWAIVAHGTIISTIPALSVGLLLASAFTGQWGAFAAIAIGIIVYGLGSLSILVVLDDCVRKVLKTPGEKPVPAFSPANLAQILLAIPLMQFVYPLALYSVMLMRDVRWRGIRYEVRGPWDIKLAEYQPYSPTQQFANSNTSVF
ncbi:glycosyltransferase [Altericista sp. CCNU0014]|uniref:glycosyltransferase n=1 Tax=Altericista sp. CCNU0014 TaxID=3082949 RepID=UPI00384C398D